MFESACARDGEGLGALCYQEHSWEYLPAPVCCQEVHKLLVPLH